MPGSVERSARTLRARALELTFVADAAYHATVERVDVAGQVTDEQQRRTVPLAV